MLLRSDAAKHYCDSAFLGRNIILGLVVVEED
jgi:hypothetical protein